MRAVWLVAATVLAGLSALSPARADGSDPETVFLDFVEGAADATDDYLASTTPAGWVNYLSEFTRDHESWLGERVDPDVRQLLLLEGLFGGTYTVEPSLDAGDAIRLPFTLSLDAMPALRGRGEAQLIRVDGDWFLRRVRILHSEPLDPGITPLAWMEAYTGFLDTRIAEAQSHPDNSLYRLVYPPEAGVGWGYWMVPNEGDAGSVLTLIMGHPSRDRILVNSVSETPDEAVVDVRVETDRRTMVQAETRRFALRRDEHGYWKIAERLEDPAQTAQAEAPEAPAPSDMAGATALVQTVLDLAATPQDERGSIQAFSAEFETYFEATSAGRRSAAILASTIERFSMGTPPVWSLQQTGANQVHAELVSGSDLMESAMASLDFELVDTADGLKVRQVTSNRN